MIQNQIVSNTSKIGNSGAQISKPVNVNGYYNVSGYYNLSKPFKSRRYIISLNGVLNYNNNINFIDNLKNTGRNWVIGQGVSFEVNYNDRFQVTCAANYNLNSINYGNSALNYPYGKYSSWIISNNLSVNIFKNWMLKSDFDYTINQGLTGGVGKNFAIINASLEKQIFKKKTGVIRLQAFDLLDQNSNIQRTIIGNMIIDSRSNSLSRYFMLTFTYRLQKFAGGSDRPSDPSR
jgi:hypothetical protein